MSHGGLRRVQRAVGGLVHLTLDLCGDRLELGVAGQTLGLIRNAASRRIGSRLRFGRALVRRLVQPLVV